MSRLIGTLSQLPELAFLRPRHEKSPLRYKGP